MLSGVVTAVGGGVVRDIMVGTVPVVLKSDFYATASLIGGIVYTVGIIPFALKRKGAHFLWHFFVFFAALIHWFGIYFFLF